MTDSLQQKAERIVEACMTIRSTDPYEIFSALAQRDFVSIHGPEHHILDGACILTAFYHAGGNIDLRDALRRLMAEGLKMPGAACGLWGVCGAVTSIGAALAIVEGTGPLSTEDWGSHMAYTSAALARLAQIGGPRCCKRDAFAAMEQAVEYIRDRYGVTLPMSPIQCAFSSRNAQCIGERCPYHAPREA